MLAALRGKVPLRTKGGSEMPELHETAIGRKLFDGTLPKAVDALMQCAVQLKRIADALESGKLLAMHPEGKKLPVKKPL